MGHISIWYHYPSRWSTLGSVNTGVLHDAFLFHCINIQCASASCRLSINVVAHNGVLTMLLSTFFGPELVAHGLLHTKAYSNA